MERWNYFKNEMSVYNTSCDIYIKPLKLKIYMIDTLPLIRENYKIPPKIAIIDKYINSY